MNFKNIYIITIGLLMGFSCHTVSNEIQREEKLKETKLFWHWEDEFSISEKAKIKKYISAVSLATFNLLGKYPFDVHYYFKRSDNKRESIPWAYTERSSKTQGVHFNINPAFDYEVMFADWTAPHEISHLSIPYLGKENAWFAEGYATYMQYQIMQELGVYTKEEVAKKYQQKIENIQADFTNKLPFTEDVQLLKEKFNYPALYWGGAKYFMHINTILLAQENISLTALIKNYQLCCRSTDNNIEMLLQSLDKDLKELVFSNLYKECCTKPFIDIYKNE